MALTEKQNKHLEKCRSRRPADWRNINGAPQKKDIVVAYRQKHPGCSQYRCQKETGLSLNTIKKWWNEKSDS